MFVGHFGAGFGAKAVDRRVSLGSLFLAAQFVDLLWPALLLLGVEHVEIVPGITKVTPLDFTDYPITHSLVMVCAWGVLLGMVYWFPKRNTKGALLIGLCLVSHWVLDLIVHRPDLPLYPGHSPRLGLGLWNSMIGTLIVEGLILAVGVTLYLRVTRSKNRIGSYGLWALVAFLVLVYASNVLGPPPPSVAAIAWAGQLQWLLVAWAYWVDGNRVARNRATLFGAKSFAPGSHRSSAI